MPKIEFRKTALEKLSSPEQLNQTVRISPAVSWVGLVVCGLILVAAVLWGIFGTLPRTVIGQGILTPQGDSLHTVARGAGIIEFEKRFEKEYAEGELVKAGEQIATVKQPILTIEIRTQKQQIQLLEEELADLQGDLKEQGQRQQASFAAEKRSQEKVIDARQKELAFLEELFANQQALVDQGLISRQAYEQTRTKLFETRNAILEAQSTIEMRQAQLAEQATQRQNQLQEKQRELTGARHKLEQLERRHELSSRVIAERSGRIIDVEVTDGSRVDVGETVLITVPSDTTLEAVFFVPHNSIAKRIQPGMKAEVALSAYEKDKFGFILGEVTTISPYPTTRTRAINLVGSETLADNILQQGASLAVFATLDRDPQSTNGYRWSSRNGRQVEVSAGSSCRVTVVVEERRPISLLFPLLKKAVGL
jgi:HlyD family secretion protein